MSFLGLAVWLVSLPVLAATQVATQVYDIDYGTEDEEILVLLNSGQVAKVSRENSEILDQLSQKSTIKQQSYKFTLDKNRNIVAMDEVHSPEVVENLPPEISMNTSSNKSNYIPTTIESMAIAKQYFKEARYNPKDSQCFNRAMVWSYEWWRNHSLKSNKILIYFTRTYIRRYNFEWWFHIAPYVHVMHEGKVVERAMDRKYSSNPRTFREWSDIFMQKDPECPVITKFSDYADFPYTGECYLQRSHMYTYQPADLQGYEAWNTTKEGFNMNEVRGAYFEAFDEVIAK